MTKSRMNTDHADTEQVVRFEMLVPFTSVGFWHMLLFLRDQAATIGGKDGQGLSSIKKKSHVKSIGRPVRLADFSCMHAERFVPCLCLVRSTPTVACVGNICSCV